LLGRAQDDARHVRIEIVVEHLLRVLELVYVADLIAGFEEVIVQSFVCRLAARAA
jgi:hypothetical protein